MNQSPKNAFVLLPAHLDVDDWRRRWHAGMVPDETPYGYHHAEIDGFKLSWSHKLVPARGLAALPFKVCRRLLGFDIEHAWRHRKSLFDAQTDVIWTHTEREFLPVALLSMVLMRRCPPMIAQIVWLADEWPRLSSFKQKIWQILLRRVSMVTCHSPLNQRFLANQLDARKVRLVEFGIAPELYDPAPPDVKPLSGERPVRVLAMGNDRHRDWLTLSKALGGQAGMEVFIASATYPDHLLADNMVRQVCDFPTVRERLRWCDVVVVPVVSNLHASGLTVTLEAVACGKPVVVTDTGGITHYFGPEAVWLVPVGNAEALRTQVMKAANDVTQARAKAEVARARFVGMRLDTRGYAHRHVDISRISARQSCRHAPR